MGFLDDLKSKSAQVVEKGKEYTEITKLNIKITTLEDEIKENKIKIGDTVLSNELPITADNIEIKELIEKINQLNQEIEEINEKINNIKNTSM